MRICLSRYKGNSFRVNYVPHNRLFFKLSRFLSFDANGATGQNLGILLIDQLPSVRVRIQAAFYSKVTTKAYLCMFVCLATKTISTTNSFRVDQDEYFLNYLVWVDFFHVEVDAGKFIQTNILEPTSWALEMNCTESTNFSGRTSSLLITSRSRRVLSGDLLLPHASHFNGLWEGAVKSAKRHLLQSKKHVSRLRNYVTCWLVIQTLWQLGLSCIDSLYLYKVQRVWS